MNRTNTTFAAVVAADKRYESFTLVVLIGILKVYYGGRDLQSQTGTTALERGYP